MGYLDEAGLAALVGKVKGQMVELTAEEYAQIDPAIKNYDNKLYFVKNDVAGYQIDNEPVANSNGLVRSGGIYNWTSKIGSGTLITTAQTLIPAVNEVNTKIGSGTLTTTAQTLIPAVNEVNTKIGSTDISSIGDGTVTSAVDALNNGLMSVGFSSPEIVTFPFTADRSGMLLVQAGAASSSTGAYIYITDRTLNSQVITAYNLNGVPINQYYPCVKGHTYAVTYQSNVNNIVHRFFAMGN